MFPDGISEPVAEVAKPARCRNCCEYRCGYLVVTLVFAATILSVVIVLCFVAAEGVQTSIRKVLI